MKHRLPRGFLTSGESEEVNDMLHPHSVLPPDTRDFYRSVLATLTETNIPFMIGGAYALERYTGIVRHTKDLDIFVRRRDCRPILDLFARRGQATELTFPHWLGKIHAGHSFVDVIFSSGNCIATVDDDWFAHASAGLLLGVPTLLCPVEEMIWSKAFVVERERYDGADIAHLLRSRAGDLDWGRLLRRFGSHWRLLLSYLVLFGFIYPDDSRRIPTGVMDELLVRLRAEQSASPSETHLCRGTLLSREQFLIDVQQWGYIDARLPPHGAMSAADVERWTDAIGQDEPQPALHATHG